MNCSTIDASEEGKKTKIKGNIELRETWYFERGIKNKIHFHKSKQGTSGYMSAAVWLNQNAEKSDIRFSMTKT